MSSPDSPEPVTGGLAGKIAGKVKEVAGGATGNDDLAREGRLQHAGAAERDRLAADQQATAEASRRQVAAEQDKAAQETAAEAGERRAEAERVAASQDSARLKQEARAAEARANAIDPEEHA